MRFVRHPTFASGICICGLAILTLLVSRTKGFVTTPGIGRTQKQIDFGNPDQPAISSSRQSFFRSVTALEAGRIPVINDWEARRNCIRGRVQNHPTIPNGDIITTSPLATSASGLKTNQLVSTKSGSQYRLGVPKESAKPTFEPPAKPVTRRRPTLSIPISKVASTAAAPKPTATPKPKPARAASVPVKKAAPDANLSEQLRNAKKEFNLNGKTIGDGKYLLVGQKLKSTSIRSEIYYAYAADSDGLPKGKRITVKISPKTESLARENLTYMRVGGGLFYRDNFVKKIDYLPDAQGNSGFAKGCSALVLESGERTLRALCDARGNTGLEGKPMRQAAVALVQCIQAMQSYGLVWTDLKAENFVITSSSLGEKSIDGIKAIDLESAVPVGGPPVDYSPEACPPEFAKAMSKGEGPDFVVKYDYDSWSYGMLLYELATGRSYFANKSDSAITNMLKQDGFEADVSAVEDENLRDLISQCLQKDPKKRLGIAQILFHPYFLTTGIGPISF